MDTRTHTHTYTHQWSVATGLGHPDYPGHLSHFLSGSKWASPGHAYMPDPDQNYLFIMYIKTAMKRSILSNRAVTIVFQGCDLEFS